MAKNVLTDEFSEPVNGATSAKVEISTSDGNLTIDRLSGGEQVLASGTLQYFESQGVPKRSLKTSGSQATLTLKAGNAAQSWLRVPWAACNGATEWQIHLSSRVSFGITAHSGGGNVTLDLGGMAVSRVSAGTGGGNMEVVLPDNAANLSVEAKTGAGNVVVRVPVGMAARISATTGLGKAIVDARFGKIDKNTYQSSDYDTAANRVDITASSGAGNVIVNPR
jgi:hypothetical protein